MKTVDAPHICPTYTPCPYPTCPNSIYGERLTLAMGARYERVVESYLEDDMLVNRWNWRKEK